MKLDIKDDQRHAQERRGLRVISVELVPTPGAELRLAKVYEILLKDERQDHQRTDI